MSETILGWFRDGFAGLRPTPMDFVEILILTVAIYQLLLGQAHTGLDLTERLCRASAFYTCSQTASYGYDLLAGREDPGTGNYGIACGIPAGAAQRPGRAGQEKHYQLCAAV